MPGDFEQLAITRLIEQAQQAGLAVPPAVQRYADHGAGNGGALQWVKAHPDDDEFRGCCWAEVISGPAYCNCWTPVYADDVVQADPQPVGPDSRIEAREGGMCGDCAYRPRSPERAEAYSEETLMALPRSGSVFWCHEGMRKPIAWVHPDGRTVPGDPDDYRPPIVDGVPFRADGRPGLLCAGWTAIARSCPF
jgi:hypothetical protein